MFTKILSLVVHGHSEAYFYQYDGIYTGTCDTSKYESFFLYVEGKFYEVTPDTFILDFGQSANDECIIGII